MPRNARNNKNGKDEKMLANLSDSAKMTILPCNKQHERQGKDV